ncbi:MULTISPECIES: aldo/keto reductase [unclassified Rathayibacter]|uniref:aldo/keto reductase n=1 Tax=unclassified Rathayibacter TaxID=2609250 RepID=UPI001044AB09|nr:MULTISPECIES: aldo/keto reductase [unclassified Rathayibacter]TCL86071.1 L-glyceraldehyde 3-phosphate reductase [Rathayibacter sp. PhB192]TCM31892.1 L-glyceraldehyde 3-phosphate reductase [Rathayibacter sp. PhB179]
MTHHPADTRYDRMTYNRSGRSGLKLPALSLGLWHNFGETKPIETQRAIVRRAFDLGITHFDLANNYGPPYGSAETAFGRILAEDLRPYRDELVLSTKAGYDMWPGPYGDHGSRKYLLSSLDQSLGRLGVEYVDVFYSHRPDPETPIEETMGALATAIQQGKALYAGVSNYSPEQTIAARDALAAHGVPLLIHQPRYSMLDRRPEESGLLDLVEREGIGAIVFSPLEQGLLTDRYLSGEIPPDSRAAVGHFLKPGALEGDYQRLIQGLKEIADGRGQSIAQLALNWVLRSSAVTSAIIGASSVQQLEQNVAALDAPPLSATELVAIEDLLPH